MKKVYLKDLKPDEVIRRLKSGEVIKSKYSTKAEIKMIGGVICRISEHEILYGGALVVYKSGAGYDQYYFEEPEELELEDGKRYKTKSGKNIWQKIKCWLKGHDYEPMCDYCRRMGGLTECAITGVRCYENKDNKVKRCKKCGKVKK